MTFHVADAVKCSISGRKIVQRNLASQRKPDKSLKFDLLPYPGCGPGRQLWW